MQLKRGHSPSNSCGGFLLLARLKGRNLMFRQRKWAASPAAAENGSENSIF